MLCFFSGIEPANEVLPRSINSVIPNACGLSEDTDGSVTSTGSCRFISPASNASCTCCTTADWSTDRPSLLGLVPCDSPPLQVAALEAEACVLHRLVDVPGHLRRPGFQRRLVDVHHGRLPRFGPTAQRQQLQQVGAFEGVRLLAEGQGEWLGMCAKQPLQL